MALDPNIAMGFRGVELQNPLNALAQVSQIKNAQNQNAMAQLQLREAEAAAQEKNMLRQLDPTVSDYESQLFRVSPQLGINYRKEQAATEASKAATASSTATAAKTRKELLGQALRDISERPSDANITAHTEDIQASPLFSKEEKAKALITQQTLLAIPFEQRQAYLASQGASASELKPSTQTVNRAGSTDVVRIPAFSGAPTIAGSYADVPLPAAVEEQKKRIARESRPPRAEAQPSAPVAVVDPTTGKQIFVSREEALSGRMTPANAQEGLTTKEIQKREAVLPQARQSVKTVSNTMSVIGQTVDSLLANPDGIDGITGLIYGVTPAITGAARKAKAELEQLKNLAFIQGITELRAASKTGAAVGNVTNREGDRFENLKASLDRSQSKDDLIAALKKLKQQAELTSQFMTEAFDETYSYKSAAPAGGGAAGVDTSNPLLK
jgi:hypothetical protein